MRVYFLNIHPNFLPGEKRRFVFHGILLSRVWWFWDSLDNIPVGFQPYNRYFWLRDPRICFMFIYISGRWNPTILTKLAYRLFYAFSTGWEQLQVSSKEQNNCLPYGIKWPNLIAYFHGFKQSVFVYFLAFILHMKQRFLWLTMHKKSESFLSIVNASQWNTIYMCNFNIKITGSFKFSIFQIILPSTLIIQNSLFMIYRKKATEFWYE